MSIQSCHTVDVRSVGAACRDQKYANKAEGRLSVKLKIGVQGTPGTVPMLPLEDVLEVYPKALTKWILAGAN
jgi:cytochrome c551/c552